MVIDASAAELAFYGTRVGLAGAALRVGQPLIALEDGPTVSALEAVAAIERGPKPLRISGNVADTILRLRLSPVGADPEAVKRFHIRQRNLGDGIPGLGPQVPDDIRLLVIAFDCLLRVSKGTWRQYNREYWIDGPLGWSADRPDSPWSRDFGLPPAALDGVSMVVLAGYSVYRELRSPYMREAWEAA